MFDRQHKIWVKELDATGLARAFIFLRVPFLMRVEDVGPWLHNQGVDIRNSDSLSFILELHARDNILAAWRIEWMGAMDYIYSTS